MLQSKAGDNADDWDKAQFIKSQGNKQFKKGNFHDAINSYTEAMAACSPQKKDDLAIYYHNRAAAYEKLQNYEQVVEDCTKALELNPKYTKALNKRAKAYEMTKDFRKCLEDVTAACVLDGFQSHPSLVMVEKVLKVLGKDRAKEFMKSRKPVLPSKSTVKTYFNSFCHHPLNVALKEFFPESELTGYRKALHDCRNHTYESIIEDCTEELTTDTEYRIPALLLRGTFYVMMGQGVRASEDFETLWKIDGVDTKTKINTLIQLALLNSELYEGDVNKAQLLFKDAENLDPNNCDVYYHRGKLNLATEKVRSSIGDFKKAMDVNPKCALAHVQYCYANFRYSIMRGDGAISVEHCFNMFDDAIKDFPDCVDAHTQFGQVLSDRFEFQKADDCFKHALVLDPECANILVQRGLLRMRFEQDVMKAVDLISQALQVDEKCAFALETLGTIEVQRGHLDKAMDFFEKAIALARTESQATHLYSLYEAACAQAKVIKRFGIQVPQLSPAKTS